MTSPADRLESALELVDHETEAPLLLTDKSKGRTNTVGLLKALVKPQQDLERGVQDTVLLRLLDNAEGIVLDMYGRLVGEKRNGKQDEDYLKAIRVRIRVNRSKGRTIDVYEVATLFDETAEYRDAPPLAWEVQVFETTGSPILIQLLTLAKAVTSYGVLVTLPNPITEAFIWDDDNSPISGAVWDWTDPPTVGHVWCATLPTNPSFVSTTGANAATGSTNLGTSGGMPGELEPGG